ncbi:hypothetical protein L6R53_06285 [Myxococcota bacterium]|nr:hypothetical protein [Myxococcota bacterium]
MRHVLLALLLTGSPVLADDGGVVEQGGRYVAVDAARTPRSGDMVGPTCTFRTGVMARRVMAEGAEYAFVGRLQVSGRTPGDVACPYTVGGQEDTCVVASELVEHMQSRGLATGELSLEGRLLEIDGVRYVVLTAYKPSTS